MVSVPPKSSPASVVGTLEKCLWPLFVAHAQPSVFTSARPTDLGLDLVRRGSPTRKWMASIILYLFRTRPFRVWLICAWWLPHVFQWSAITTQNIPLSGTPCNNGSQVPLQGLSNTPTFVRLCLRWLQSNDLPLHCATLPVTFLPGKSWSLPKTLWLHDCANSSGSWFPSSSTSLLCFSS